MLLWFYKASEQFYKVSIRLNECLNRFCKVVKEFR